MSDTETAAAPAKPDSWLKSMFKKNGEFSKTATFASIANVLVLTAYVMSWFAGSQFTIGELGTISFPAFDAGAAAAVLGILNGTYLANNQIKAKAGA